MDSTGCNGLCCACTHSKLCELRNYLIQFELLVDDLAEWGPESKMLLNNYISVPSESAQSAATKLITF